MAVESITHRNMKNVLLLQSDKVSDIRRAIKEGVESSEKIVESLEIQKGLRTISSETCSELSAHYLYYTKLSGKS
ncbi:MAG TPA: hypothetical protein VG895_01065 [Patescibacteria group bacterium]|nr:hypothetical protein [Patescibacteria group bacterium]